MRRALIISILALTALAVQAQDIHFSQFLYSPLTINPALTGNFDGKYRLGMNYRQQWRSVSQPFRTYALWGDSRDFLRKEGVNLGLHLFYDQAGTSEYNTFTISVPLSYRIKIKDGKKHSVNFGIQPAFTNQSINPNQFTTDSQYNGGKHNPDLPTNEELGRTNVNYFNLSTGFTYNLSKPKWSLVSGIAVYNLFEPDQGFYTATFNQLPRRWNVHAGARVKLKGKWFLTPGVIYSRQDEFNEFVFGTEFNYTLNSTPYKYRVLFAGVWNRGVDAEITNIGMYYNNWRVAVSYDVNYSSLSDASSYRGGWELSVIYILREILPKRINYKYCPNYI